MQHPNPPTLPAGSVGFLATRHDRPERRALYFPGGNVACSFSMGASIYRIEMALAEEGLQLGAQIEAPASWSDGGVWAVVR